MSKPKQLLEFDGPDDSWTIVLPDQIAAADFKPRHIGGPTLRLTLKNGTNIDVGVGSNPPARVRAVVTRVMTGVGEQEAN